MYTNPFNIQSTAPPTQSNTNKIFVRGIEELNLLKLIPNSNYIALDNDKNILYDVKVDGVGQRTVKYFKITEMSPPEQNYASKEDLNEIKAQMAEILKKLEVQK